RSFLVGVLNTERTRSFEHGVSNSMSLFLVPEDLKNIDGTLHIDRASSQVSGFRQPSSKDDPSWIFKEVAKTGQAVKHKASQCMGLLHPDSADCRKAALKDHCGRTMRSMKRK